MSSVGIIVALKIGYLLLAWGLLGIIYWLAPRAEAERSLEKRFRALMLFRTVNILSIIGYVFFEVRWPLWLWLTQTQPLITAFLWGDLVNFSLLIGYLSGMLFLIYWYDRKTKGIVSGFGSYLMQYGYFWVFVINILVVLRLDYYYLPLMPEDSAVGYRWVLEVGAVALLIGLQLIAHLLRGLKMVPADPEVERLVREVAAQFNVRVSRVKIWRLEKVINAFATGIFFKKIYLTEAMVYSLTPDDLKMIVGHECAHFKRKHLEWRAVCISGLVVLGSFLAETRPDLPLLFLILYLALALIVYKMVARFQEYEADRVAALKLGGGRKMAAALARLSAPVKFGKIFKWLVGHPDIDTRIKRLILADQG